MPMYAPNTLAQQLTKACARAVKSTNTIVRLGRAESGLLAILTSAQDARVAYRIRRVAAWLAGLEAPATVEREASIALQLVERSERTLAGQPYSQEERLQALVYLPVAIAAYAVVLGSAHAWQWHQVKEEQWDRYQACRMSQCWY